MAFPIFVGSAFVAQYPEGGGSFWVPLQYVLGLRELGFEAYWLEYFWSRGDAATDQACIATFQRTTRALGAGDWSVLVHFPDHGREAPIGRSIVYGMDPTELTARRRDGLLLNLAHSVTRPLREGFARTVLFDLDPGAFQLWANEWDMGVGAHDVHLTIGMHLGEPDSPIPLRGVSWQRIWPAIHLGSWPVQAPGTAGAAYSTVTQWWSQQYAFLDGETYDCNKRTSFMQYLSVPKAATVAVTLAANLAESELEDRTALAANGWTLVAPHTVCGSAESFRTFVQGSRGEFSCAKPAYVKARAGWISDRTLC